jgi:hypothetical protein
MTPTTKPAEQLFRGLLSPRPSECYAHRFAGIGEAPGTRIRALSTLQDASAADHAAGALPFIKSDIEHQERARLALVADDGEPLFESCEQMRSLLTPDELAYLLSDVQAVHGRIGPRIADGITDWIGVLTEGARHQSNSLLSASLAEHGAAFFGVPPCELTDGQQMAIRAARKAQPKGTKR